MKDVEEVFARFIPDADPVPTRAVFAAYVANRRLDGDPVWLMLVGGSGVGKTERLTPLAAMPDVILASSITGPAALLSGTARRERSKEATGGLLRTLPNGSGVLVLKDFTSVLSMHRDARAEVLAAFRELYDGRWDRTIGADGGRTLTWIGSLGLIAGCTTAIDSAHGVMAAMGPRFVLVRLTGDASMAASALAHVGCEAAMRDELKAVVGGFLADLPGLPHPIDMEASQCLIALSQLVALARSPVERDSQGEITLVSDPESPTRLVKTLGQLWRACGLIGLSRADAWLVVRRVGLDSIPKLRHLVLDCLTAGVDAKSTTDVAEATAHPSRTTRRALEDLTAHGVAVRKAGGSGNADLWTVPVKTRAWLGASMPVSSEKSA